MCRLAKAALFTIAMAMLPPACLGTQAQVAGRPDAATDSPSAECAGLQQVVALAAAKSRFAPIAGAAREGNFRETLLALPGWQSCALYGNATFTCDSSPIPDGVEATRMQTETMRRALACLGPAWAKDDERSAAGYLVLHPAKGAAAITLSIDRDERARYLIRLTLFVRTGRSRE
jgi:hypothetical protein